MEGPPGLPGGPFFVLPLVMYSVTELLRISAGAMRTTVSAAVDPHTLATGIGLIVNGAAFSLQTRSLVSAADLGLQCLRVMAQMVIDKGADEVIAVIVARLNTQRQRMIRRGCS